MAPSIGNFGNEKPNAPFSYNDVLNAPFSFTGNAKKQPLNEEEYFQAVKKRHSFRPKNAVPARPVSTVKQELEPKVPAPDADNVDVGPRKEIPPPQPIFIVPAANCHQYLASLKMLAPSLKGNLRVTLVKLQVKISDEYRAIQHKLMEDKNF